MSEIQSELGSFYENLGNAIDFSFDFQNGSSLRLIGMSSDGTETPTGSNPKDVMAIFKMGSREEFHKLNYLDPSEPEMNADWCRKLILALGRQSGQWLENYSFSNVLDFACESYDLAPKSLEQDMYKGEEEQWVREILGGIDTENYSHVWDSERHRQNGKDYYNKWHRNTEELRK